MSPGSVCGGPTMRSMAMKRTSSYENDQVEGSPSLDSSREQLSFGTPYSQAGSAPPMFIGDDLCSPQIPLSSAKKISHMGMSPNSTRSATNMSITMNKENQTPSNMKCEGNLNYEITWRDEKIRLYEMEKNSSMKKMEELTKQNLHLREENNKLRNTSSTTKATADITQLIHERDAIQEYAEQIRQQKTNLQEQLNVIKQGHGHFEREIEKRGHIIETLEKQNADLSKQLSQAQKLNQGLLADKEKLQQAVEEAQSNLLTKTAEFEELHGIQEELLNAVADEKKKNTDLSKIHTADNLLKEKLKKENERLELLVDKLQSDSKRDQQENFNQRIQFNSTLEDNQRRMQDEIESLKEQLAQSRKQLEDCQLDFAQQNENHHNKIATLNDHMREQLAKYERNLNQVKIDESEEKKKYAAQILKYKKELQTTSDIIKHLKEANKNLEDHFVQNKKIISVLEERLEKEKQEKEEALDYLDILKNKLPNMLQME